MNKLDQIYVKVATGEAGQLEAAILMQEVEKLQSENAGLMAAPRTQGREPGYERLEELAERLVSPGSFPNMSASEGHELYEGIQDLLEAAQPQPAPRPVCPKCGKELCVIVDTDPSDYQSFVPAIMCQDGKCNYKVFPGWDAKDWQQFFTAIPAKICTENWRCKQCGTYYNTKPTLPCSQCDGDVEQFEYKPAIPAQNTERDSDEAYAECSDKAVTLLSIIENANFEEGAPAVFELRKLLPNLDKFIKHEIAVPAPAITDEEKGK